MNYARTILQDVEGYTPGEQPQGDGFIKLNTNENPYPPSPRVVEAIRTYADEAMRKYPDPLAVKFRAACAKRYGFAGPEWVFAGNGMDEVLAMAVRAFVDPDDTILSVDPTYTLYETLATLHGAAYQSVELTEDFKLPEAFFNAKARLCFLPRPNAPSGVPATRAEIERFCREFGGIVVIDEAYADFAGDNCMDLVRRLDNVIVGRTFSKSFSLAGMRLGIGCANTDILAEFFKTKDSYNVNGVTQAAGLAAISDYDYMLQSVRKIRETRSRMTEGLRKLGFDVPDSQTNFVLASYRRPPGARGVYERLKERRILVRYFDTPRLQNSLRISVGTDAETDALLTALREILT